MKYRILLLIGFAITLTACSNEALLERKEDRILGAWEFDRVTYKEDGRLFRDDVTRDFRGDIIEFYRDYSAVYEDASLRVVFDGFWELNLDRFADGDEEDVEFFLDMSFYDFVNQEEFSYFCNATTLTRNRMTLVASNRAGTFTFRMRKI